MTPLHISNSDARRLFLHQHALSEPASEPHATSDTLALVRKLRKRTERLFGFDYRIEVFVPETKQRYGYYVLPLIEGDRFAGRADMKTHRGEGRLEVKGLWLEPGVKLTRAREAGIRRALVKLARFTETPEIDADAALRRARDG